MLFAAVLLAGCSALTPDVSKPHAASMGRNGAHSGIYALRLNPDGAIAAQLWYPQNRDTFNSLVVTYGKQFLPQLALDDHLTSAYPTSGWLLESAYVKGQIVPVEAPSGMWQADDTAIQNYVQLLNLRRADVTP